MKFTFYSKYKRAFYNIVIFLIMIYLLSNSKVIVSSISISTNIFISKLIPALFPYLLITELLIHSGKIYSLSYGLSSILAKFFHIPKHTTSIIIVGFLLGYPNAAKCIATMYNERKIDENLATKLISFTSNANISYIIASIGIGMFQNIKIGIILAISHYLAAIIIGILITPSYNTNIIQQTDTNSNTFNKISAPFELLYTSILGTLKTLAFIFSYTVIFSLIPSIIFNNLNTSNVITAIITGIFEISNGINEINLLNISLNNKLLLTSFVLSFSSLMILIQIFSFASNAKVKFKNLLKYKLLQGILSCITTFIIINCIYSPIITAFNNIETILTTNNILPANIYTLTLALTIIFLLIIFRKKRQAKPVA